jgi:hypothetical protein
MHMTGAEDKRLSDGRIAVTNREATMAQVDRYKEFPAFVPVGEELVQLAKYWLREKMSIQVFLWYGCWGPSDLRRCDHTHQRVYGELVPLLGEAKVKELADEAAQEFCRDWSPEDRRVFLSGDEVEMQRLAERVTETDEWLNAGDTEAVLQVIKCGSRESPVASRAIERRLGLSEEQIWHAVRNLKLNGKAVCYPLAEVHPQGGSRPLWNPTYWCPASDDEWDAWVQEARFNLARARHAYDSVTLTGVAANSPKTEQ